MMKKRKTWVAAGCIALLAVLCFGLSGVWRVSDAVSVETPPPESAETDQAAFSEARAVSSAPEETSPAAPAPEPSDTRSPKPETGGAGDNPQGGVQPSAGNVEPRNTAGGTANEPPSTPAPATVAPTPAPAAPDPAPAAPQPTPTPEPLPPATPAPQPVEQPKPGGYAYCSCGAVLSEAELVAHMKQHALNGESHHYDTY